MPSQNYTFALDPITIHNTRAAHLDTDYVSFSLSVGGQPAKAITRAMGNLNNGTYGTGLVFPNVAVDDTDAVVFSYAVVNSGHTNPGTVEQTLQQAVSALAQKAAQAVATAAGGAAGAILGASIGTAVVPLIGSALGAVAGWLVTELAAIGFPICDGPVAAGVHTFTGAQLRAGTDSDGVLHSTDNNPGTNSPAGCGSNSNYDVTWTVRIRGWQQLPGKARDIGVGANGSAWVIGNNPVGAGSDSGVFYWDGATWQSVGGGGVRITVDNAGNPWIVNSQEDIYRWVSGNWQQLPGKARDIGVGANGSAWVIGNNPVGAGSDSGVFHWDGATWQQIDGGGVGVAVDNTGNPWIVNSQEDIYRWL